jgi:phosphatidate cytidylyltransferase
VLRTRLWTAAIALPILIAAIFFSSASFFRLVIAVLGSWGLYEIADMTGVTSSRSGTATTSGEAYESRPPGTTVVGIGILLFLGAFPLFSGLYVLHPWVHPTLTILLMLGLMTVVALRGPGFVPEDFAVPKRFALIVLGAIYVGVLFPYFALLRNAPRGISMLVLMFTLVFASDSGAYFVGRAIGRTKLMPLVSPNKTVEGAIGGLLASIVSGLILRPFFVADWSIIGVVIFSAVVAVLAQLGDLTGSAFKRTCGVKDSGWLFPGHGGMIDRTCSLVFATVFTYYCSR